MYTYTEVPERLQHEARIMEEWQIARVQRWHNREYYFVCPECSHLDSRSAFYNGTLSCTKCRRVEKVNQSYIGSLWQYWREGENSTYDEFEMLPMPTTQPLKELFSRLLGWLGGVGKADTGQDGSLASRAAYDNALTKEYHAFTYVKKPSHK